MCTLHVFELITGTEARSFAGWRRHAVYACLSGIKLHRQNVFNNKTQILAIGAGGGPDEAAHLF